MRRTAPSTGRKPKTWRRRPRAAAEVDVVGAGRDGGHAVAPMRSPGRGVDGRSDAVRRGRGRAGSRAARGRRAVDVRPGAALRARGHLDARSPGPPAGPWAPGRRRASVASARAEAHLHTAAGLEGDAVVGVLPSPARRRSTGAGRRLVGRTPTLGRCPACAPWSPGPSRSPASVRGGRRRSPARRARAAPAAIAVAGRTPPASSRRPASTEISGGRGEVRGSGSGHGLPRGGVPRRLGTRRRASLPGAPVEGAYGCPAGMPTVDPRVASRDQDQRSRCGPGTVG